MAPVSALPSLLFSLLLFLSLPLIVAVHGVARSGHSERDSAWGVYFLDAAAYPFARCLDGSLPYYYLSTSRSTSSGATASLGARSWVLYLEGGAWCNSPEDCYARSETYLGSGRFVPANAVDGRKIAMSKNFPPIPYLSSDCEVNPEFCDFNKVVVHYCDGNSFTGQREEQLQVSNPDEAKLAYARGVYANLQREYENIFDNPLLGGLIELPPGDRLHSGPSESSSASTVKSKTLFFRGRYILDAVIEATVFNGAGGGTPRSPASREVMLTGCSAGGLAALLHADRVREKYFQVNVKFRAASFSGWFMDVPTVFPRAVANQDPELGTAAESQTATTGVGGGVKRMKMSLVAQQFVAGARLHESYLPERCVVSAMTAGGESRDDGDDEEEKRLLCVFAANAYPHTRTPIFIQNSALDAYQLQDILTREDGLLNTPSSTTTTESEKNAAQWAKCTNDIEECSGTSSAGALQIRENDPERSMITILRDFEIELRDSVLDAVSLKKKILARSSAFLDAYFLDSCVRHCESEDYRFWLATGGASKVDDHRSASLQHSLNAWWRSTSERPTAISSVPPCIISNATRPFQCDEKCSKI
eukprot:g6834.t1